MRFFYWIGFGNLGQNFDKMNVLFATFYIIGGIGSIITGIWLSIKELKTLRKWHNDKWSIGNIKGLGVGLIVLGVFLISQAFN